MQANHTNSIVAAVEVCKEYMLETFSWYLDVVDFDTVDEYAEYIAGNPDGMELLAVMLTARLNRLHICVHHPASSWHTHVPGKCVCAKHFAYMGELCFMALEPVKAMEGTSVPVKDQGSSTATMEPVKVTEGTSVPVKDPDMQWVHCIPRVFPTLCSQLHKNCVFKSAACIEATKGKPDQSSSNVPDV